MARDNCSYQKHQKELARKKKKEEKMQRRLNKKNIQLNENLGQVSNEDAAVSSYLPPAS